MNEPSSRPAEAPLVLDWKTVIAALVATFTVTIGVGSVFRQSLLADVDARIATHAVERSEWRSDITGRITRMEQQCVDTTRWRERADAAIESLQDWRHNCSAKMAEIREYKDSDAKAVADLAARVGQLEQFLRSRP